MSDYDKWNGEVIDHVEMMLDITRSDAQGIVMAQAFTLSRSWAKALSAKATAEIIADKFKTE